MSIKKRGATWHLDIALPTGGRLRRSAETSDRKAAQELHDQLKAQLWRQEKLGEKPLRSFDEAADRWELEHASDKGIRHTKHHLKFWRQAFAGMALTDITRSNAAEAIEALVSQKGTLASAGTRMNYVITLRALLNTALKDWEWIDQVPSLRTYGDKAKRKMCIATPAQAKALLAVLPPALRAPIGFAFMTGLRKSNVFGLTWDRVDLARSIAWVEPIDTKAENLIVCPLNSSAKALLEQQLAERAEGETDPRVFPTLAPCFHQWKRYVKRAGLPAEFRFHDIRHTFASWLALDGTDRKTLQELGGWKSPQMLETYVHLPTEHLVQAAERLSARLN